jgi:hypothetical protein
MFFSRQFLVCFEPVVISLPDLLPGAEVLACRLLIDLFCKRHARVSFAKSKAGQSWDRKNESAQILDDAKQSSASWLSASCACFNARVEAFCGEWSDWNILTAAPPCTDL